MMSQHVDRVASLLINYLDELSVRFRQMADELRVDMATPGREGSKVWIPDGPLEDPRAHLERIATANPYTGPQEPHAAAIVGIGIDSNGRTICPEPRTAALWSERTPGACGSLAEVLEKINSGARLIMVDGEVNCEYQCVYIQSFPTSDPVQFIATDHDAQINRLTLSNAVGVAFFGVELFDFTGEGLQNVLFEDCRFTGWTDLGSRNQSKRVGIRFCDLDGGQIDNVRDLVVEHCRGDFEQTNCLPQKKTPQG